MPGFPDAYATEFTPGSRRQQELQESASRYLNKGTTEFKIAAE